jgi:hypothetical protein
MHETGSKNFIDNIDAVVTENKDSKVKGWIVPFDYSVSIDQLDLKIKNDETGEVSAARWNYKPRKDVYDFYQGKADNYLNRGLSCGSQ